MKIPYVIDNVEHRLADVINAILQRQPGRQVDIATAYFSIRGYQQVRLFLGHAPDKPGRRAFLHAKCYLFYGGPAGQGA